MSINRLTSVNLEGLGKTLVSTAREQADSAKFRDDGSEKGRIELTRENSENLVNALNSAAKSVKQKVSFSFHEKTHRIIMKIQDGSTNETIREIPPKEMIRLLEHMQELLGMFIDESR